MEITGYFNYTARAGETWDEVAFSAYKSERMSTLIIQANPQYIDVIKFDGGEVLRVPVVDDIETPETLPPWRR